jgi:glycosyltransferase involved in cell wall biosynthesis
MPDASPPITVVIPAFNRAATIRSAIESVLRQTRGDFELLVVDDASTDATAEIVAGLDDPRLRLVRHETNAGAGAARNTGIHAARGIWIAFQDSDDEWLPLKLEKQMARLETAGEDVVAAYCGMVVIGTPDGDEGTARPRIHYRPRPEIGIVEGALLPTLLRHSLISTQTLVARRDTLLAIGGFDASLRALEDWECALRLAEAGRIVLVDEPLVLQRFSPNSLTRDAERQRVMRMRIIEKHRARFAAHPAAFAYRLYENAGGLRRRGAHAEARRFLAAACRLRPGEPRYWAMLAHVTLLSLLRRRAPDERVPEAALPRKAKDS